MKNYNWLSFFMLWVFIYYIFLEPLDTIKPEQFHIPESQIPYTPSTLNINMAASGTLTASHLPVSLTNHPITFKIPY